MCDIDVFNPCLAPRLWKRMQGIPAIYDRDEHRRIVERFQADPDDTQVPFLGPPPLEVMGGSAAPSTRPGWSTRR